MPHMLVAKTQFPVLLTGNKQSFIPAPGIEAAMYQEVLE